MIGTPAAQERAELAKAAYTHLFCGRAKMGISAYDDQGLVTRKAVNFPCYAEVRPCSACNVPCAQSVVPGCDTVINQLRNSFSENSI